MENTWEFGISFSEALALASLLKINTWLGLPPLGATPTSELDQLCEAGFQSLIKRNLITLNEDSYPFIHSLLNHFLETVQSPWEVYALVSGVESRWLFLTPELFLEQGVNEEGIIKWVAVRDEDTLKERMIAFYQLHPGQDEVVGSFQLLSAEVQHLAEIENNEVIETKLKALGLPEFSVTPVRRMIRSEEPLCSFTRLNSINPSEIVTQTAWLATSKNPLWVSMEAVDGESQALRFESVGYQDLCAKILENLLIPQT